jgi:ubiquinone/menaquinone biosynthesis C-methylase UbiE
MRHDAVLEAGRVAGYADVADEYYDRARHPTCATLRELSALFLSSRIGSPSGAERRLVEVGVGRSLLAPAWVARGGRADQLVLIDSSPAMLSYSDEWRLAGATLLLADACALPVPDGSVDLLVASLGDPYNLPGFWREVARVLQPEGRALFTAPAHEWATRFRAPERQATAEFVRRDGAVLLMPSLTPSVAEQVAMIEAAGLKVTEAVACCADDLDTTPAAKLLCMSSREPLLRGYAVRR